MQKNLKLADTCEECMYRNLFFEVRNELKAIERKLVRCMDCRHWSEEYHDCGIRDSYGWDYKPTDFCSYGERREE